MSDQKVIPFRKSSSAAIAAEQAESELERDRIRASLLAKVREARGNPKCEFQREDEFNVAWAIGHLYKRAGDQKIKPRAIQAALEKRHINTRHLERIRIYDTPDIARTKKTTKGNPVILDKKIHRYLQVLDVLAELLGHSVDDVIFEAFKDTAFGKNASISSDDPAAELTWLLRVMAEGVIRAEQLLDYFQTVRTIPSLYIAVDGGGEFLPGIDAAIDQASYEGTCAVSWSLPPLPSIPLIRIRRASFTGALVVERRSIAPVTNSGVDVARIICGPGTRDRPPPLGAADTVDAELRLFTDVRLVIGPTSETCDAGALLERRSFVQLLTDDRDRPLTFPFSLSPLATSKEEFSDYNDFTASVAAGFDDGWHRVTGFGPDTWKGDVEFPENFGTHLDSSFWFEPPIGKQGGFEFAWYMEAVDISTVTQLMQLFAHRNAGAEKEILFDLEGPYEKPSEIRFLQCRELETALHTGSIEQALRADCQRLRAKLDGRVQQHKVVSEQVREASLARWRAMAKTPQEKKS